jgi:hypothetical protein
MTRRRARGTTKQRGYSGHHPKLRAQWEPAVASGLVLCHAIICLKSSRLIRPGEPWDLGHTADRTAWTGPEHMACNRADGARRKNRKRRPPPSAARVLPQQWVTSRRW